MISWLVSRPVARARALAIGLLAAWAALPAPVRAQVSFDRTYVDLAYGGNGRPGWVRPGDMGWPARMQARLKRAR